MLQFIADQSTVSIESPADFWTILSSLSAFGTFICLALILISAAMQKL